jgi:hypothetical protein
MTDTKKITPAHEQHETLQEDVWVPEHFQRTESFEFRRNKRQLVTKLNLGCWICDAKEKREVHHFACEWSLWNDMDPAKVLEIAHTFDPYGFAAHNPDAPIESPDDIRNLMVLCEKHHRAPRFGVHTVTFPIWVAQRSVRPGVQLIRVSEAA